MRYVPIEKNCYYHVLNRGDQKQRLFRDERDWVRFLFLIIFLQSKIRFDNIHRQVDCFIQNRCFNVRENQKEEVIRSKDVELINFCLMPNHFHLTVFNKVEGGISRYLHSVATAFSKYFNTKYEKSGHVFQGTYKAVPIFDDNQLAYLSAYIHKNPRELAGWKDQEHIYPWSSFQDYDDNRWGPLLKPEMILEQFNNFESYRNFVKRSFAKEQMFEA